MKDNRTTYILTTPEDNFLLKLTKEQVSLLEWLHNHNFFYDDNVY